MIADVDNKSSVGGLHPVELMIMLPRIPRSLGDVGNPNPRLAVVGRFAHTHPWFLRPQGLAGVK
jgi:hypothetical protein